MHVVGFILLALLLQAFSPLLHARLQALAAATTGQRIDVAAFCLPGQSTPPAADGSDTVPPSRLADCQLCQGGTAPAADMPAPVPVAVPAILFHTLAVAAVPSPPRTATVSPAHRPRGPPLV